MKRQLHWPSAKLRQLIKNDAGQDLVEYGLLAGFISVACIAAIHPVATRINTMLANISTALAQVEYIESPKSGSNIGAVFDPNIKPKA